MNRKRKEHWIPNKSYLNYFIDDKLSKSLCNVYKKETLENIDKIQPKLVAPDKLFKESYFYESPDKPLNAIEDFLADIEGKYKKILDNKILNKKKINDDDKKIIEYFLSTFETRTLSAKEYNNSFIDKILEHVVALEKQFKSGKKSKIHEELIKAKEYNLSYSDFITTSITINRRQFADFQFLFVDFEGEDQFFITSDNPVSQIDFVYMNGPYGLFPQSPTLEIILPLTPKIALFANNIGIKGYKDVPPNFVREINHRTLTYSSTDIISPHKLDSAFINNCVRRFTQSFILFNLKDELKK